MHCKALPLYQPWYNGRALHNPIINEILNNKGYIAGDAFDDKVRKWFYAFFMFDKEIAFHCSEDILETTGEFYKEE